MVESELKSTKKQPIWLMVNRGEQNAGGVHYHLISHSHKWRPPTDVIETDQAIIVRVEIAGMQDSEFSISLNDRILTIQGIRPDMDERHAFHQMEIRYGEFFTDVMLNWAIDSDALEADYSDGILKLVLPKAKVHQIKIEK